MAREEATTGEPPRLVLVVGVAGSGKSTVGRLLAERLGWAYGDADEFHTEGLRARMAAGHALTDSDREPWLDAIGEWMDRVTATGQRAVVACSALKRAYRDRLLAGRPDAVLVYLHGSRELLESRLASRHGHFFPAALLDSQLAVLQEPEPDEHPLVVEIDQPPEAVVTAVLSLMRSRDSGVAVPAEGPGSERAFGAVVRESSAASPGPTGGSWRLVRGEQSLEVVRLGGALRAYDVNGRPLLDGFSTGASLTGGRGQLLVPWPNRVDGGRYRFDGRDLQLPLTEVEKGNSIHGLLRWTLWELLDRSDDSVTLGTTLCPQPGYPFLLDVRVEYRLGADGLRTAVRATNTGTDPAPYGVGQHPYLTVGTELVDSAVLTVPARNLLRTDGRGLPIGQEPVDGTPYDFRTARPIGDLRLDTAFTGLDRDPDGRAIVRLAHPSGQRGVDLWLGEGTHWVQVYTGDTLAEPERRRRGVAVEAMSCPPDAFRSGTDLTVLQPGATHVLRWGLSPWGYA